MSIDDSLSVEIIRPFDERAIRAAVERYQREYDRYLKLCARVADICRELVDTHAMRAQVTSRAKTPKSLDGKLRRILAAQKKPLTDVDSVFKHVRDLAAVRIATYEARHEAEVIRLVCDRFQDSSGAAPVPEPKDYERDPSKRDNYYRATHVEVFLRADDIVGTYANVKDVPCEIQACSLMAHVWNEIEHDLGYKPFSGSLSQTERDRLVDLGRNVRLADSVISQLLAETDKRLAAETAKLTDVWDFVARLRGWFPGVDFGRNAGPLFDTLRPKLLDTPEAIRRQIDLPEPLLTQARARCEAWRATFGPELDPDSSDLLLVALLPKLARVLVRDTSREPGAVRIRTLAEAYLQAHPTGL